MDKCSGYEYAAFVWDTKEEKYVQVMGAVTTKILCRNRYKEYIKKEMYCQTVIQAMLYSGNVLYLKCVPNGRMKQMVIRRNGNGFGLPAEVIEIELIPQKLEQAYRIKEKEYRMQDAYENGQVDSGSYETFKNNNFYEKLLTEYDKRFSCEIAENVIWERALASVLL